MTAKNIFRNTAVCLIIILSLGSSEQAFTATDTTQKKVATSLNLIYLKNSNETKTFTATLTYVENRETNPVNKAKIRFLSGKENKQELAVIESAKNGKAILTLPKNAPLEKDAEGFYNISAEFAGDATYDASQADTKFQDMQLNLNLEEADSTQRMKVKGFTMNDKGEQVPLKDLAVNFYVARMFSYLKVGDATLDETGNASFEFPEGLPGDSLGNLILIARVDENDTYGNVEARQSARWGKPTLDMLPSVNRALWTQIAPTWMIITLIILLSGVWGHYVYAIVKIFRIKRAGLPEKGFKL